MAARIGQLGSHSESSLYGDSLQIMCDRYVSPDSESIERAWSLARGALDAFARRFNVLPGTRVPVLRGERGGLFVMQARWGFIPRWWTQTKPPGNCHSARVEDAATKPMWRDSYRTERCLIPADGWYEWSGVERVDAKTGEVSSHRQPHFVFLPEGPVCFAGLMSLWKRDGQLPVINCAILTREAPAPLSGIHPRIPLVLPPAAFKDWLNPNLRSPGELDAVIASAVDQFSHYPVSPQLTVASHDDAEFVKPIP
jgi:putative SOS response-associated peptidase YedK